MDDVAPSETLSRFILQRNHYRPSDNQVKYAAFLPHNNKTSVFRTSGIAESEVWDIGDKEVAEKRGKSILGRADITAYHVLSRGLKVIPFEPPVRHANITEWPREESKQKQIALELAADAQLLLKY